MRFAALLRGSRARLALAAGTGFGTVAAGAGLLATGAFLIVRADQHPPILDLTLAIVGVRFFGIARAALRYGERLAAHDGALRLTARLRTGAFAAVERLAPGGLDDAAPADLLVRVADDLEDLQQALVRAVLPVLVAAPTIAGAGIAAGLLLPRAGLLLGVVLTVTAALAGIAAAALGHGLGRRLGPERAALSAAVLDLSSGAAEAVAFGRAPDLAAAAMEADGRLERLSRRAARIAGLGNALVALGTGAALWLVLREGVDAVHSGRLDPVALGVLAMLVLAAFEPVALLPAGIARLESGIGAGSRIADLEARPDPVPDPQEPVPLPAPPHRVSLDRVRLRHRPAGTWALNEVSLDLGPGRRVALVGESGAGKSSVAEALLRFRPITGGGYSISGVAAGSLTGDRVRTVVGLAGEEAHLVAGTIGDNLLLARPDAAAADVAAALRATHLESWVAGLPAGLDTPVGTAGAAVSGGERRRISLARALLAGFPILIADEPTAGLDPDTARAVVAEIIAASSGRGLLLITHGTEGLAEMDEVVVLERGRVAERGSHDQLLARGGRYARFWAARETRTDS